MSIIDTVKAHPIATGGVVIVGILLFYMISGSGGSGQSVVQTSDDGQATQMAQINASLAAAQYQTDAALQAQQDQNAHDLQIAQIQKDIVAGQYAVQMAEISSAEKVTTLQSTLSARVQEAGIGADVQKTEIARQQAVQTTQLFTNALVQQSQIQANAQVQSIKAAGNCGSFFGAVFGC